jgi:sulfite dehydrogenase (cytochrome) subunit B
MKIDKIFPLLAVALMASVTIKAAVAAEAAVPLKDAPGRDVVENNCGACHSLDYIRTNSPFLAAKLWEAEVAKMISVFGAPIEPSDAKTIVDYLSRNYGAPG